MSQVGTHVRMKYSVFGDHQACMCWGAGGWKGCLNTSHQYRSSAMPPTGISVPSEEITEINGPLYIFMLVYHNSNRQNELGVTELTCNSNRQNDFDIISLSMTLPI